MSKLKGIVAKDLIIGKPFGTVFPLRQRNLATIPPEDGRTAALRVLALYISELVFYRRGDKEGEPIAFSIPLTDIHIEQPNNDVDVHLPCVVFTQDQDETYESRGLATDLDESSADVHQSGTVLQVQYDQTETFVTEIWATSKPERRALIAGLQTCLTPTEQWYGIRFKMPDYYGVMVVFTPVSNTRPDEQSVRGRRIARMRMEMRFEVVALVDYRPLTPSIVVNPVASDDPTFTTLVLDVNSD